MKKLYNIDISIVTLITVFCLISIVITGLNNIYIRIIVEYLMILFLPGYSILIILFPKNEDLKFMKRLTLSFILSIATALLISLIFNYILHLTSLTSILFFISVFTLILQPISILMRKHVYESYSLNLIEPLNELFKRLKSSFKAKSQKDKIISIVLIAFIFISVFTTAYIVLSPKEGEKFTEFYILGPNGKAYDYPTNLSINQSGNVIIGIVNHEAENTTYNLMVKLNGVIIKNDTISLKDEEKKEIPFTFYATNPGQNQKLEFLLYKLPDNKNVYRYLFLQINV